MKKIVFILCAMLCSCKNLPPEYYKFDHTVKKDVFNYELHVNKIVTKQTERVLTNSRNPIGTIEIYSERMNSDASENFIWKIPSVLTLGTINLLGWPSAREVEVATIDVIVKDMDGKKVKRYSKTGTDWAMNACYYGYSSTDAKNLAFSRAYKQTLREVLLEIDNDSELYELLNETQKERIVEQKKKEKAKQEKMNKVLSEMDDM